MKIKYVETMTLDIPFYCDHVTRAMQRAQTTMSASIYVASRLTTVSLGTAMAAFRMWTG